MSITHPMSARNSSSFLFPFMDHTLNLQREARGGEARKEKVPAVTLAGVVVREVG